MALGSMFGRRTDEETRRNKDNDYNFDDLRDRDPDGVDDRAQTGTIVSERHQTRPVTPDGADTTERITTTTTETTPTAPPEPAPPPFGGRTSFMATLGLVLGVTATLTALTGLLAPVALAIGVLGLLFTLGGVSASGRRTVNGRGVAMLGMLGCLAGIVLAVVAMSDTVSWLTSDTNYVSQTRDWLDTQFPWLKDW
jgi:hypothetical protein